MERYGCNWPDDSTDLAIELACVRLGGRWKFKNKVCGDGMLAHVRRSIELLWPDGDTHVWTTWDDAICWHLCSTQTATVMGPGSSGKTHGAALFSLVQWYASPSETVVIVSSTSREMLKQRLIGQIWSLHHRAKERFPELAGMAVESRLSIELDQGETVQPRGIYGVACLSGGEYKGLGNYVGIKAPRVLQVADELQLMPRIFLDATANLKHNPWFQFIGLGNPTSELDALCLASEPVGGWDVLLDGPPRSFAWPTRFGGRSLALYGLDTPNGDSDPPTYPWLITRKKIQEIADYWGQDSVVYASQALGRLTRSATARRMFSRSMCIAKAAMMDPFWVGGGVDVVALDPAFTAVGGDGDRCILLWMRAGYVDGPPAPAHVVAVVERRSVIIHADSQYTPEDEIARFVKEWMEERNLKSEKLYFDSTNRGSLALALARELGNKINAVDFGGYAVGRYMVGKRSSKELYNKRVSELWFAAREALRHGQIRGLDEELVEEFASREYVSLPGGKVDVEPKRLTRERLGRSPDSADAFCIGLDALLALDALVLQGVEEANYVQSGEEDSLAWSNLTGAAKSIRSRQNLLVQR
jgi:hypothetical protein